MINKDDNKVVKVLKNTKIKQGLMRVSFLTVVLSSAELAIAGDVHNADTLSEEHVYSMTQTTGGLSAALQAMADNHPILKGKQALLKSKSYEVDAAKSNRYPSMSVQASSNDDDSNQAVFRIRQPLWSFGRINNGIQYAKADVSAEQTDLTRVKRELVEQTVTAYVKVLGSQQHLKVAEENVNSLEQLYKRIERRDQGGVASMTDVRLARARLVQARAQQGRYEGDLAVAEYELQALTQVPIKVDSTIPVSLTELPNKMELEKIAQTSSANILHQINKIALTESDVERQKVSNRPTVYLQMDNGYNDYGQNNSLDSESDTRVSIVLDASFNALGATSKYQTKAAKSRLLSEQESLIATRRDISRQVSSLYAYREQQKDLISSQASSVSETSEILASYQRQYSAGLKSWLDVLNMQRELTQQRFQYMQAENDWLTFTMRLAVLTGRLDALVSNDEVELGNESNINAD